MSKIRKFVKDVNGMHVESVNDLIAASRVWLDVQCQETAGTGAANGTELISLDIPAQHVFICTHLEFSCNEGRGVGVCNVNNGESLGHASQVENMTFGSPNIGLHSALAEEVPIFVFDNSGTSSSAKDLKVYAPHTLYNATNDPATSYFSAYIGGVLVKTELGKKG